MPQAVRDLRRLARALVNLSYRYSMFALYRRASDILDEVNAIAHTTSLPQDVLGFAGLTRAVTLASRGELASAKDLLTRRIATPIPFVPANPGILGPTNRGGLLLSFLAFATWASGDPEDGLADAVRVREMAEQWTPGAKAERGYFDPARVLAAIARGAELEIDLTARWNY